MNLTRHLLGLPGGPAPRWPFPNVDAYYGWCSSDKIVQQIRVPFLAINADDDPVVKHVPMDGGGNNFVVMTLTKGGWASRLVSGRTRLYRSLDDETSDRMAENHGTGSCTRSDTERPALIHRRRWFLERRGERRVGYQIYQWRSRYRR